MKYRRLTQDELQELEPEFVRFLASNQITAADWQKLKEESPEKVKSVIELFSDIVFDKVIRKVKYLDHIEPRVIRTFHCKEDHILMFGVQVEGKTELDFSQNTDPQALLMQMQLSGAQLKLFQAEKGYKESREEELFRMMENGCLISRDGKLFKTLSSMAPK